MPFLQIKQGKWSTHMFEEAEKEVLKLIQTNAVPILRKSTGEPPNSLLCLLVAMAGCAFMPCVGVRPPL